MSIQTLNPYIHFDGEAAKAIELYEKALGARTVCLMRYSDAPGTNAPPDQQNRIMHSMLEIGDSYLMLGDGCPGQPVHVGTNVQISIQFKGEEEMTKAFEALSAGGEVTVPLADAFWGATFGTLTDAFGVRWMFNCEKAKETAKLGA